MKPNLIHIADLNTRDPYIVADKNEGKYFLYSNHSNQKSVPVESEPAIYYYTSKDLQWWDGPHVAYKNDEDFWGPLDYWAPEVHVWKDKYYLLCSYRSNGGYRGCQCHVADTPKGPFVPMVNKAVTPEDWHCLDGTLYVDKENNPWMVFCHEWTQVQDGQMVAMKLSDDLSEAIGEPVILFRASEAPWKGNPNTDEKYPKKIGYGRITDGPFMHRAKNGELLMIWSSFSATGYAVGCARSKSGEILGPWVQDEEPIYAQSGAHGMLFNTFEGDLILTLHSPNTNGDERILLFDMEEKNGRLHIINERTGNWLSSRYDVKGNRKK